MEDKKIYLENDYREYIKTETYKMKDCKGMCIKLTGLNYQKYNIKEHGRKTNTGKKNLRRYCEPQDFLTLTRKLNFFPEKHNT